MFYAIEYAYGRTVVNNGQRADRVLEFTSRRLRDAWVADGSAYDGAGARDVLGARDRRVRGIYGLEDGDREGWQVIAEQRIANSAALSRHTAIIFYDWPETDHYQWVATALEREIVDWARRTEEAAYEVENAE